MSLRHAASDVGARRRWFAIQRILGALIAVVGATMLPSLMLTVAYGDGQIGVFVPVIGACWLVGFALWFPVRRERHQLRTRDGFLVVTLIWFTACAVYAFPLTGEPTDLSYIDALFESTSGLTTTGATVLTDIESLPRSLLFYRQWLHFLGGMGIVILAVAVLPMLRIGGAQLFRAETTGPVKDNRLTPRIAETAKKLWIAYVVLNVACAVAYWLAGMSVFDAITHAFSTVATGGYANYDASFGHFDSVLIEVIAIIFMIAGALNFALHYLAWARATTTHYFDDAETRTFASVLGGFALLTVIMLWLAGTFDLGGAVRHGIFQLVSTMTTTGFGTTGFAVWPAHIGMLMLLVALIGGCSGSTTGGLKVVRVLILFRQATREILQLVHPRGRFLVKVGQLSVPGQVLAAVTAFAMLYATCLVVLSLAVAATGTDMVTAVSAVIATLTNMGPGLGEVASNYSPLNDVAIAILTVAMLLGRLEVFTILVLLSMTFWRD